MDKLRQELKEMTNKLDKKEQEMEQLKVKQEQAKMKQDQDRTELERQIKCLHPSTGVPVQITMPDFEKHKAADDEWFSEPFYTHPGGYRMCLSVYTNGNRFGKGKYVSVYAYLMRGEYDDLLKWPLLCDITVQLLNQKEQHEHTFNFGRRNDNDALRVTKSERAKGGWGEWNFISHTVLYRHRDTYLKDGCIQFQITKVQLKN